jgi:hypothetical protein
LPLGAHRLFAASDRDGLTAELKRTYNVRTVDFAKGVSNISAAANRIL